MWQAGYLAPMATEAYRAGEDPAVRAMRDLTGQQIMSELQMGEKLTPEQQQRMEEAARSAEVARGGTAMGAGAVNRESVMRALEGERLAQQRRASAEEWYGHEDIRQPDPFSVVLGTASAPTAAAISQYGAGMQLPQFGAQPPTYGEAAQVELGRGQLGLSAASLAQQQYQYETQMASRRQFFPLMY